MALEYILSKGRNQSTIELVIEIFNPTQAIGGQDFDEFAAIEDFDLAEIAFSTPYIGMATIAGINAFHDKISTADIANLFDAAELNKQGIYPEVWHNDNSPDQAFNVRHMMEDIEELKSLVGQAAEVQDYIMVYGG